ncbi:ThuA domain-containing protein [Flavimobilis sp. GY10621]|uniref:ThuA domain-containing protein n=1 Tax=Flavimobilis rhizosphaerae TaxID=2775421 RepID=A0ABR9DN19_9MICO|nr:ThuA domain-containing protein [Flavimobilis rhizosphaerae]MBD9698522.1 ThuA domain-containing protein [Flavimobilis rhizosphaerae]
MTARQALVVRGGWDGHAPQEATDLFVPFLEDSGFTVVVSDSLEVYADTELMSQTDLVLQSWTMGEILGDEVHGLRAAVAAGTGLVGWHGGVVDSFRMSAEYLHLMGAQFAAHPGDSVEHAVRIVPERADHPVVAGLEDFTLRSERYWLLTDPLLDVLATTTIDAGPDDPWDGASTHPAVWTRRWGAGRIVVCAPGHHLADLAVPQVRTIIERGLLWAARG